MFLVITPNKRTFFFPETENLNLMNENCLEQDGYPWLAMAVLKITTIQIFIFREEKNVRLFGVI